MKLKVTYESEGQIVTITWTPDYGFDIAGAKTLVDKFTMEEIQPRGHAVAQALPPPPEVTPIEPRLSVVPERPNVGTAGDPMEGQVLVTRNGEKVWIDEADMTDEEREAAEEAQAAIDRAIAEAGGEPDDDGDDTPPTPAAMPKKRGQKKARPKPKCQACNHAWHNEECTALIGTGQQKQPCGCLTAVL